MPLTAAGDVRIVETPGHTNGHVSVVVESGAVDGVAPDPAKARETLERIRRFSQDERVVYLPAHDPQAADRLAARTYATP